MGSHSTVSLEPHLAQNLKAILHIVPADLCDALSTELGLSEIHYSILSQIAQWARTDAGRASLCAVDINPREYDNMVSLLAGTRTSPSSKPPPDPLSSTEFAVVRARRDLSDRRALLAVLNGLLSVGCAGGAVWWAADKSGWRDEWKVLMALLVATVVGVSETVLFIIWQSRTPSTFDRKYKRRERIWKPKVYAEYKKSDDNGVLLEPTALPQNSELNVQNADARLQRRTAHAADE